MTDISKTFSAVDQVSASFRLPAGRAMTVELTGTFVATIVLEVSVNNGLSWQTVATYTDEIDATPFPPQLTDGTYRFRCSAYTSGSPVASLASVAGIIQAWRNVDDAIVFYVDDNGAVLGSGVVNSLAGDGATYAGAHSFQVIGPDLNLDPAAGSGDGSNPKFLAAVMGNVISDEMTTDANYLAGVIGAYSVTGTKATSYPAGAVLGVIMDGVDDVDGAFVAVIDGDGAVTKANAAYAVKCNNSNAGSGFNYGLDLYSPSHDGYLEAPILKADLRLSHQVCVLNGDGVPVDGTTGATFAEIGSLYIDRTNGKAYINGGTKTSPTWKIITSA